MWDVYWTTCKCGYDIYSISKQVYNSEELRIQFTYTSNYREGGGGDFQFQKMPTCVHLSQMFMYEHSKKEDARFKFQT